MFWSLSLRFQAKHKRYIKQQYSSSPTLPVLYQYYLRKISRLTA